MLPFSREAFLVLLLDMVQDWVLLFGGPLVVMAAFGRLPMSVPRRLSGS